MMKKRILRAVLLALLCTCMILCLFACKKDVEQQEAGETTTAEQSGEENEARDAYVFPRSDMGKFKVVFADGSTEEVETAANNLQKLLNNFCKTEIVVTNDFLRAGSSTYCEFEYEILIGNTNREESGEFLKTLRQDDYGWSCTEKKIVIGGLNDYTVKMAVESFTTEIVMNKKAEENFYAEDWNKTVEAVYAIKEMKLNGTDIADWRIVYPAGGKMMEADLAQKLQLAIADRSGFMLEIVSDKSALDGKAEILIGKTNRQIEGGKQEDRMGYAYVSSSRICLDGATATGIALAVGGLEQDMVQATKDGVCDLSLKDGKAYEMDHEDVIAMSFNIQTYDMYELRTERVISTILRSMPDVFGVQEANNTWMQELKFRFGGYYDYVGTGTKGNDGSNEHCAIFYAKERYTLIEGNTYWLTDTPEINSELPGQEWPRVYTYVVLEDKVTKDRFLQLNIHLDTQAIRVKEVQLLLEFLEDYNDIPVIVTGDMNATSKSDEMKLFFDHGFVEPLAALKPEEMSSQLWLDKTFIDYVLITSDSLKMTDYVVEGDRIYGGYASDHPAIYIRFHFLDVDHVNHGWGDANKQYPDEWLDVEEPKKPEEELSPSHPAP